MITQHNSLLLHTFLMAFCSDTIELQKRDCPSCNYKDICSDLEKNNNERICNYAKIVLDKLSHLCETEDKKQVIA